MNNTVKTFPVPHISEEDVATICKSHRYIGLLDYDGAPIRVYYWPWEEIPGATVQTDMVLFHMSDGWFMQPFIATATIQDSLTSLCGHPVSIQEPMVFTRRPDNWVGISATTEEVATSNWADYWLGGQHRQIRRLELTLAPSRRLKPQPRDNMGLFFTYDEYLDMYLASAGTAGYREQAYYMEKACRAAEAEGITYLHSALADEHADIVAANAARPYGELDEDWESLT
jgi:hypothetical protein